MAKLTDDELVDELQAMAEEKERESALTFADSLATWLESHASLTDGQREKAEEILDELNGL